MSSSVSLQKRWARAVESARVESERERMAIYREMPTAVTFGLAARELAGKLHTIEHLNLSPDMLGTLFGDLLQAGSRFLEAKVEEED